MASFEPQSPPTARRRFLRASVDHTLSNCASHHRHCDVYKLLRSDFDAIVEQYPQPAMRLVVTAQQLMAPDFAAIFKAKVFKIANPKQVGVARAKRRGQLCVPSVWMSAA